MKNERFHFFVVALGLLWNIAIVAAQDQAPAPSFKEGDSWQFSISRKGGRSSRTDVLDGIYELVFTQGNVKLYEINGSQRKARDPRQGLLTLVGKSETLQDIKFPLSVGQKWTYQYETRFAGNPGITKMSAEVNVLEMEQVTTPAGSFKAYKLVKSLRWPTQGRGTTTYFYCPETRSIVKSTDLIETEGLIIETELIKFTPGT